MKRLIFAAILLSFVSVAVADDKRYVVPIGDSPRQGPENASVTIIEFLDFQ